MNESLNRARARYQSTELPPELSFAVASALREGERRRACRRAIRRSLGGGLAACLCFCLLVNGSPAFAAALADVPVLGQLARIVTVESYQINDRDHLIDVRLPALTDTGDTDLEQRINTEIHKSIDQVLDEAEERAREAREAFVETGGKAEDFMPIIIDVDYEVKCSNGQYLSFVITKTETLASAYTEYYLYNLDLTTGTELTLPDLLGPDWREQCDEAVRNGIAQSELEGGVFFAPGEGGFETVSDDQKFFLNADGDVVLLFEKYELAPGYMGAQEFTVSAAS
ncbi:DUF3298 domain-containing protein [Flavonifractor sp. An92]|uniref:DUF3298 and DUF4163 domain-containing protein n=1 Tax=Flavonifractor sp. An92 TaxID=1965666 RepID=UPI000B39D390|nr:MULTISPECIES: DUF3298 and DUF4163 domain-containing protein [unclassified Flavonifractor]OUN02130.1 DUF3298 domain-containing protein [Flavonifractor sp. An92]OUQ22469.1 DUF3298 domain-containing protein [Flavonifractor sp. An135]